MEATDRSGRGHPRGQRRRHLRHQPPVTAGDVGRDFRPEAGARGADPSHGPVVIGRNEPGGEAGSVEPLVAVGREIVDVGVDETAGSGRAPFDRGPDRVGDGGAHPIGADGHGRGDLDLGTARVVPGDSHDPAGGRPDDVSGREVEEHVCAGVFRGGDEDRVQHGSAGRVEGVDPAVRLHRDCDRLVTADGQGRRWRRALDLTGRRQRDGDRRTSSDPAGETGRATVSGNQTMHDREPEPTTEDDRDRRNFGCASTNCARGFFCAIVK